MAKKFIMRVAFRVILPLFLGLSIYFFFRDKDLALFKFIPASFQSQSIQNAFSGIDLPEWIIYSLPDGLWLYAFISFELILWKGKEKHGVIYLVPVILALGSEMAQYFHWIAGTFCQVDILFYILATGMAFIQAGPVQAGVFIYLKPKLKYAASVLGLIFFMFVAAATNGPADAVQDMYIQDEKDPVKKEKMQRIENWYHAHGRKYPTSAQHDSINRAVEIDFAASDTSRTNSKKKKRRK